MDRKWEFQKHIQKQFFLICSSNPIVVTNMNTFSKGKKSCYQKDNWVKCFLFLRPGALRVVLKTQTLMVATPSFQCVQSHGLSERVDLRVSTLHGGYKSQSFPGDSATPVWLIILWITTFQITFYYFRRMCKSFARNKCKRTRQPSLPQCQPSPLSLGWL